MENVMVIGIFLKVECEDLFITYLLAWSIVHHHDSGWLIA